MQKNIHYCIFKLKFSTPVRFGAKEGKAGLERASYTCYADTLFSALCNEILLIYGQDGLKEFISCCDNGEMLFSDMFPYYKEELFLPRPFISFNNENVSLDSVDVESLKNRKKFKKLSFLPASYFKNFLNDLETGKMMDLDIDSFGIETTNVRVNMRENTDNLPYAVSSFTFNEDAGLYFILGCMDDKHVDYIRGIVNSLGLSGIGGKRSSGFGKFNLYEDEIYVDSTAPLYESDKVLGELLESTDAQRFMNLSVLKPSEEEFKAKFDESDTYSLAKRSGFIYSDSYSSNFQKKESLLMFKAGSCFKHKFNGIIQDVSTKGSHPVLRYGKGLYIGI